MAKKETYHAETIDPKVGLLLTCLASLSIYFHEDSPAGWLVVACAGVLYTALGWIVVQTFFVVRQGTTILAGILVIYFTTKISFLQGAAEVAALRVTVILLILNVMIFPLLNPHILVRRGGPGQRRRLRRRKNDLVDWTAIVEPPSPPVVRHSIAIATLVEHSLIASAFCLGAFTTIATFVWPAKDLIVVSLLVHTATTAAVLGRCSQYVRSSRSRHHAGDAARINADAVLYLRPFAEDDRIGGHENHLLGCFVGISGYIGSTEKVEISLVTILSRVGPVVAIAHPGEAGETRGAVRLSPAKGDWRSTVASLIDEAAWVVIQVGKTAGIQWEIMHALESRPLDRIIFWVPRPFSDTSRNAYERLRYRIRRYAVLPPWHSGMVVISFQPDRTPLIHQATGSARVAGEGRVLTAIFARIFDLPYPGRTAYVAGIGVGVFALLELYLRFIEPPL